MEAGGTQSQSARCQNPGMPGRLRATGGRDDCNGEKGHRWAAPGAAAVEVEPCAGEMAGCHRNSR